MFQWERRGVEEEEEEEEEVTDFKMFQYDTNPYHLIRLADQN
jgi:hypothetical protein